MIRITNSPVTYTGAGFAPAAGSEGRDRTMAYSILKAHNTAPDMDRLKIRFDAMASHDITYVGIIQTARASGMTEFPVPYVLTNCHNSLCAVGGTINEDDHVFGLSAAKKYGGEFVPAHQAVIHSYMRERYAAPGRMILGSDSHTRYGAYGAMAIGEGGAGPPAPVQDLRHSLSQGHRRLPHRRPPPRHRPSGRGSGPDRRHLPAGHREKRGAGILRPRRSQPSHGLPLRH